MSCQIGVHEPRKEAGNNGHPCEKPFVFHRWRNGIGANAQIGRASRRSIRIPTPRCSIGSHPFGHLCHYKKRTFSHCIIVYNDHPLFFSFKISAKKNRGKHHFHHLKNRTFMTTFRSITQLCNNLESCNVQGNRHLIINSIVFDSRKVSSCSVPVLYVAQRGTQTDGHQYIQSAIADGAQAILCETLPDTLKEGVTYIQVPNTSIALGRVASAFYDHPSQKLKLVGITGTNGKTTTVTLLHQLFYELGYPVGLLSTIVNKINNIEVPATHTTPDAVQLNELLHEMVMAGCEYCFIEVSSHAVVQHRIEGLHFTGGIFSNITHDHLDFHETFANLPKESFALTNIDDKNGMIMVQNTEANIHTYSILKMANFKAKILENSFEGLHCTFNNREVYLTLCGKFNVYNLLAIYATTSLLSIPEDDILVAMSRLQNASGRFQVVRNAQQAVGIVDYAHTPDALRNVLTTIRDITENSRQIITIVGCGGDRDKAKRPIMAEVACQYSHKVILTSDNPRTENPQQILEEMQAGVPVSFKQNVLLIENRREAIKVGSALVQQGILLVAGKGHENYQEIYHVKHHFDDIEELHQCGFTL